LTVAGLFYTPERHLRAPWRIVLFLVVTLGALLVATTVEGMVVGVAAAAGFRLLLSEWSIPVGYLLAHAVMLRSVERKGWDYVGLHAPAARPSVLGYGAVLGTLAIAVPSLILLSIGQLRSVPAADGSWWVASGLSFANLLPAAFGEELLLRGYIFSVLREAIGWRFTLISTSIVFGLLHVPNPGSDGQSIVLVMLAGFFLGSILLATKSLYAATAAHFAWNWFMAAALHSPVSGLPVISPDYRVIDAGPDWLTGGQWGPEGGLGAALGMFCILIYLHARPLRRMES